MKMKMKNQMIKALECDKNEKYAALPLMLPLKSNEEETKEGKGLKILT